MVRRPSLIGKNVGQFLMIASMTGLLASCGGSSGDSVPLGEQDADNDTIINDEDDDADGDNILDINDNFVDLDGDGLDDITLLTEAEANGEVGGGDEFVAVSAENPCGSESGTDNASVNNDWNDNCLIERSLTGGQFADSFFAVGIQRVLYCSGYGSASSYTVFADGEYGENSEAALREFQDDEPGLTVDGIVGPQTWARLQERVQLLDVGVAGVSSDTYGFTEGRCAGIAMFYQDFSFVDNETVLGGWTLARNVPNEDQQVPFSYEEAFGRL